MLHAMIDHGMLAPARMEGRSMARDDPAGGGAETERPSGETPSAAMAEFEELLRRIVTAPPKTYDDVKLRKPRRRVGATKGGVRRR